MDATGYALFDTAIGRMGVAWSAGALVATQLPARDDDELRALLLSRSGIASPAEPPSFVRDAIELIRSHSEHGDADLTPIPVDLARLPPFARRVTEALRRVPPGSTMTYAELASSAGSPKASRAVGQVMARNPWPLVVPCHRVVAAAGPGGFTAPGGLDTKARLLALEGRALRRR